jgi:hypothetical protein
MTDHSQYEVTRYPAPGEADQAQLPFRRQKAEEGPGAGQPLPDADSGNHRAGAVTGDGDPEGHEVRPGDNPGNALTEGQAPAAAADTENRADKWGDAWRDGNGSPQQDRHETAPSKHYRSASIETEWRTGLMAVAIVASGLVLGLLGLWACGALKW